MTDSKDKATKDAAVPPIATIKVEAAVVVLPKYPPLEASARRLERLFGGTDPRLTTPTSIPQSTSTITNDNSSSAPSSTSVLAIQHTKILKKWLGSSSGAAGQATLATIAACAEHTLDPRGPCATGRELLLGLVPDDERTSVLTTFLLLNNGGETAVTKDDAIMEMDENNVATQDDAAAASSSHYYLSKSAREVESWLISLTIRVLWRSSNINAAYDWSIKGLSILDAHLSDADRVSTTITGGGGGVGGLYPLLARLLRYRSLVLDTLPPLQRSALVASHRSELASRYTTSVLRRDVDVSATVINITLHDLLLGDQIEQAQKLLSNATFPTENASNNQLVRYLYYSGRVQALRLEYTSAYSNLSQALRKCPTNVGLGFRIAVQRLLVVVQLLMGEVPDRSVFFGTGMIAELRPYLEISQAVRRGDLAIFHAVVTKHADRLRIDGTYTLISRLAHSVVKAGLRQLKTSYSRISLDDVAQRLGLSSSTSAEFVVAKAVRDGVIDATIDHEKRYIQSHDLVDVYATVEPSEAFHRRIAYCLTTHNDAVRAMRYTPDAYKRQLEASRGLGRRGRGDDDDKTDEEKAKEIEDEFDEDY
jgi:26S proteasome regulatory subunit N3